jgi:hypothetical protein
MEICTEAGSLEQDGLTGAVVVVVLSGCVPLSPMSLATFALGRHIQSCNGIRAFLGGILSILFPSGQKPMIADQACLHQHIILRDRYTLNYGLKQ